MTQQPTQHAEKSHIDSKPDHEKDEKFEFIGYLFLDLLMRQAYELFLHCKSYEMMAQFALHEGLAFVSLCQYPLPQTFFVDMEQCAIALAWLQKPIVAGFLLQAYPTLFVGHDVFLGVEQLQIGFLTFFVMHYIIY